MAFNDWEDCHITLRPKSEAISNDLLINYTLFTKYSNFIVVIIAKRLLVLKNQSECK